MKQAHLFHSFSATHFHFEHTLVVSDSINLSALYFLSLETITKSEGAIFIFSIIMLINHYFWNSKFWLLAS